MPSQARRGPFAWLGFSVCAVVALAVIASCAEIEANNDNGERVLANVANEVILPTYREFDDAASALDDAIADFVANPSAGRLAAAQGAWRAVRAPWGELHAFTEGPFGDMGLRLAPNLDQYPAAEARIEATMAKDDALTADSLLLLGANERGFFTLEYLLWGDGDNDEVLAAFTGDGTGPARRRAYLRLVSKDLAKRAGQLITEWEPDGGNYVARYTTPGLPDSAFESMKQAISKATSNLVFASEDVSLVALGDPLGKFHGGEPKPEFIRGWRSDNASADMQSYLIGVRNVYNGSLDGARRLGLGVIVQERNAETHRQVEETLEAALESLRAMPRPLKEAIEKRDAKVEAAYDANTALTKLLAVDVIAALGATLSPSDNDGD